MFRLSWCYHLISSIYFINHTVWNSNYSPTNISSQYLCIYNHTHAHMYNWSSAIGLFIGRPTKYSVSKYKIFKGNKLYGFILSLSNRIKFNVQQRSRLCVGLNGFYFCAHCFYILWLFWQQSVAFVSAKRRCIKRIIAKGKSFIHLTKLKVGLLWLPFLCVVNECSRCWVFFLERRKQTNPPGTAEWGVRLKYICLNDLIGTPYGHLFVL